jgi:hypothetical protein
MLFLQGARDAFAQPELLNPLVKRLGSLATLHLLRDADHSFHVPARGGVTDAEINAEMLAALAAWAQALASPARPTATRAQSGRANS